MNEKKNVIKHKSFLFAIRIIKLYQYLCEVKREFILSKQLLRSGTAIGALVRESQKECDETIYWLELLKETSYLNEKEFESIFSEAGELLKMIRSAILTTKSQKRLNS